MNGNMVLNQFGPLSFDPGLPTVFRNYMLPGAVAIHARGPWGFISMQELNTLHCTLRYFLFQLSETLSFRIQEKNEGLQSLVSRGGLTDYRVEGLEPQTVFADEFLLLNAASQGTFLTVRGGKLCALCNTYYRFPGYSRLLSMLHTFGHDWRRAKDQPAYFVKVPRVAPYVVHDTIRNFFADRRPSPLSAVSFELRLQDSLVMLLAQTYIPHQQPPTRAEREVAYAAREMILSDISRRIPIKELAASLYCTPLWLQRAFHKVYGIGPFHFLRQKRMERAKEMLLRGEPLKTIVPELGMVARNFPREFKAYFGYTITSLKKGMR